MQAQLGEGHPHPPPPPPALRLPAPWEAEAAEAAAGPNPNTNLTINPSQRSIYNVSRHFEHCPQAAASMRSPPPIISAQNIKWAKTAPSGVIGARVRITGGTNTSVVGKYGRVARHGTCKISTGEYCFYEVRLDGMAKTNQSLIILTKFCRFEPTPTDTVHPTAAVPVHPTAAVPESSRASRSGAAYSKG